MAIPYVVSADIYILMQQWVRELGFILPNQNFFRSMRMVFCDEMRSMFPYFDFVEENELREGMRECILHAGLPPVSLEKIYTHTDHTLEITRCVTREGINCGLRRRTGFPSLRTQMHELVSAGLCEVVLVDDVIFSGVMMSRLITVMQQMGINVPKVCTGIGIRKGVEKIIALGCEVECVRLYDEVIDEVCERDFYPGVPYAGRSLVGSNNIGVPYLLPFGNPREWASIPQRREAEFSRFCIAHTIALFEEIEQCSGKIVKCNDLIRRVLTIPHDNTRFVDALRKEI
ncbi:MAG: hypothetical protein KGI50_03070 [Patescibacteria group bacterium]|nr:hypothetical protein [Patescibacteria group bacterium]MDE2438274.1 hypothetical protein [Patescibacteria group bacterium]